MSLVLVGVFVLGICMSATAALYVPKKKSKWPVRDEPKVKVTIQMRKDK